MQVNAKKKISRSKMRDYAQVFSMGAIPLLCIFIFSYMPMFGIVIAFKNYLFSKGILGSEWIGLKNFDFFMRSNDFLLVTRNTLMLNALFIVTGIVASVALAILLYELKSRFASKVFQTLYITPHFISWVIGAYMVYALLNPQYGLVNEILTALGQRGVNWYAMPNTWIGILTITNTWKTFGMDSIIYYAALMAIDSTLFEAAYIDGANRLQVSRHIILPSLIPLISILTILKIGGIFRADFGLFYQVTMDSALLYSITDVVDTYVYRTMRMSGSMGISTAVSLLQSIVGFVLVIVTNQLSKKIDPDIGLL